MELSREPAGWPLAAIEVGAALFVVTLAASVPFDPRVWLLHTVQALLYGGVIVLARRGSVWGLGMGLIVALLWNAANLFVTGFAAAGADALWTSLRTGHLVRPVVLLILVGVGGNFLMILGCLVCFLRRRPGRRQWAALLGGAVLGVAALALIVPLRHHDRPLPLDIDRAHEAAAVSGSSLRPQP